MRGVRCGGDYDVPLCAQGLDDCAELRAYLAAQPATFDILRVSPLQRTLATAEHIHPLYPGARLVVDDDLRERLLGNWNNRSIAETAVPLAASVTPPGGESEADFRQRIARSLASILADQPASVLVVASSGVARVMHSLLGGEGRIRLPNAQMVRFRFGRGADEVPLQVNSLRVESGSA